MKIAYFLACLICDRVEGGAKRGALNKNLFQLLQYSACIRCNIKNVVNICKLRSINRRKMLFFITSRGNLHLI